MLKDSFESYKYKKQPGKPIMEIETPIVRNSYQKQHKITPELLNAAKNMLNQRLAQTPLPKPTYCPYFVLSACWLKNQNKHFCFFTESRFITIDLSTGLTLIDQPIPARVEIRHLDFGFFNSTETKLILVFKTSIKRRRMDHGKAKKSIKLIRFVEYDILGNTAQPHFVAEPFKIHSCEGYKNFILYSPYSTYSSSSFFADGQEVDFDTGRLLGVIQISMYFLKKKISRVLTTFYHPALISPTLDLIPDFHNNRIYYFYDGVDKETNKLRNGAYVMDMRVKRKIKLNDFELFFGDVGYNARLEVFNNTYVFVELKKAISVYNLWTKSQFVIKKTFSADDVVVVDDMEDADAIHQGARLYYIYSILYKRNFSEEQVRRLEKVEKAQREGGEIGEFLVKTHKDFVAIYQTRGENVLHLLPKFELSQKRVQLLFKVTASDNSRALSLISNPIVPQEYQISKGSLVVPGILYQCFFSKNSFDNIPNLKTKNEFICAYNSNNLCLAKLSQDDFNQEFYTLGLGDLPEANLPVYKIVSREDTGDLAGVFNSQDFSSFFLFNFLSRELRMIRMAKPKPNLNIKLLYVYVRDIESYVDGSGAIVKGSSGKEKKLIFSTRIKFFNPEDDKKFEYRVWSLHLPDLESPEEAGGDIFHFSGYQNLLCFRHKALKSAVFYGESGDSVVYIERVDETTDQASHLILSRLDLATVKNERIFEHIQVVSRGITFFSTNNCLVNRIFEGNRYQIFDIQNFEHYSEFRDPGAPEVISCNFGRSGAGSGAPCLFVWSKTPNQPRISNFRINLQTGKKERLRRILVRGKMPHFTLYQLRDDHADHLISNDCISQKAKKVIKERDFEQEIASIKQLEVRTAEDLVQKLFKILNLGPKMHKYIVHQLKLHEVVACLEDPVLTRTYLDFVIPLLGVIDGDFEDELRRLFKDQPSALQYINFYT